MPVATWLQPQVGGREDPGDNLRHERLDLRPGRKRSAGKNLGEIAGRAFPLRGRLLAPCRPDNLSWHNANRRCIHGLAHCSYLTQSILQVVLQRSILTQIRQSILHYCSYEE